ncbi:MAG: protein kinase [Byssovorax sp.]
MSSAASNLTAPIVPGTILAGKFRVERIIGQGGMGMVVEARHIALDERFALKFLLPEYSQHPEASQRFQREARAASKLKSEHVARVSDVSNLETGAPYMVMEFLEGTDLSHLLEKQGPLPVVDAVDFIIQGCEAIAEAHSLGIVHRDLKPANLFLSKRPDGSPIIKVLDFGISKMTGGGVDNLTKTTAAMGSALYMSPEQMQQTRAVDHRTDIYALGIALYELLAGKQPFYADTLPQLCAEILTGTPTPLRTMRPDLGDDLASAIEKAYARDKGARYQSIADFVVALAPWAPPRSQTTIDRVARMAGLTPPTAGALPPRAVSAPAAQPQQLGGTQVIQQYEPPPGLPPMNAAPPAPPPPAQQAWAPSPPTAALPAGMGPQQQAQQAPQVVDPRLSPVPPAPQINPNQIVPGHYSAPISSRAAAVFAQGPVPAGTGPGQTTQNGVTTAGRPTGGSGAGLAIGGVLGLLAIAAAAAAFFFLRKPADAQPQPATGQSAPVVQTASAPASATVAPPPVESATAKPEEPKAAPSATVSAATHSPLPNSPKTPTKGAPTSTPSTKPTVQPKVDYGSPY